MVSAPALPYLAAHAEVRIRSARGPPKPDTIGRSDWGKALSRPLVWTLQDWASAVEALPAPGGLPDRIVIVPNHRVAHALRRELVERNVASALVGTRFITLVQLALDLIRDAGEESPWANDRELGPVLLREAFSQVAWARFDRNDMIDLPGWDVAFTRTLSDLEAAGVDPARLLGSGDPHVIDVGRVYEVLRAKGELATVGSILRRAAAVAPTVARRCTALAVVTGFESPAEAQLLQALPELTCLRWAVRPRRKELDRRALALFSEAPERVPASSLNAREPSSALQQLQLGLFESLASTKARDDDSVRIVNYSGVHEEVEAAAGWVVEQILEHGVPAHDIAILSATAEPYGSLLRARLSALPWPAASEPVFSARGIPLTERADGARLLIALRALREGLSRDGMAELLPILRGAEEGARVRGGSHAWGLLNAIAFHGGERANLAAGCGWGVAIQSARARIESAPSKTSGLEAQELRRRSELLAELSGIMPAIEALTDLLRSVLANERLGLLWERLSSFARAHLKLPPATPPAIALLDKARLYFIGQEAREPKGCAALAWLEETLRGSVVMGGRFGAPSVYLGTLAGVRGLSFRAVRIVGLVEGAVPSAAREDPVLPDAARTALSPFLLTSRERAHQQLAAFDDAVRTARQRLVLSAPRVSVQGSVRQPAAVLLDVMRVLSGANTDLEAQLEAAASGGRRRERSLRDRNPVSCSATLERIAHGDSSLARTTNPALSLEHLRAIRDRTAPAAQDGLLGGAIPPEAIAGLSAERPISASRLSTLLACPHRYLYEHVLGYREPEGPAQTHALDLMSFGSWLHEIAEEFWRAHGAQLGLGQGELSDHTASLKTLAGERFEELRRSYPFANDTIANAAREALCDQLVKLLSLDWNHASRPSFVDVERGFGFDAPCTVETPAGPLHLRGRIDKLDLDRGTLLVRDIKTGAGKPRRAADEPELGIDLQLAVYALVAKQMASAWGTPAKVGVAYIYLRSGESDRSWIGPDYARLERAAKEWLATARETLEQGAFVRTPEPNDCTYCAHKPVCASEMHRATVVLTDLRVPRRFARLKQEDADE